MEILKILQAGINSTGKEVGKDVKITNYCVDYTAHALRGLSGRRGGTRYRGRWISNLVPSNNFARYPILRKISKSQINIVNCQKSGKIINFGIKPQKVLGNDVRKLHAKFGSIPIDRS